MSEIKELYDATESAIVKSDILCEQFHNIRKARGITQDELAEMTGLCRNTISLIETGASIGEAKLKTLTRIAHELGCELVVKIRQGVPAAKDEPPVDRIAEIERRLTVLEHHIHEVPNDDDDTTRVFTDEPEVIRPMANIPESQPIQSKAPDLTGKGEGWMSHGGNSFECVLENGETMFCGFGSNITKYRIIPGQPKPEGPKGDK